MKIVNQNCGPITRLENGKWKLFLHMDMFACMVIKNKYIDDRYINGVRLEDVLPENIAVITLHPETAALIVSKNKTEVKSWHCYFPNKLSDLCRKTIIKNNFSYPDELKKIIEPVSKYYFEDEEYIELEFHWKKYMLKSERYAIVTSNRKFLDEE